MKKYLSILLVLLFLVGVVSPTFAVGDAATDEAKAEIEGLLEKYNEYVLIVNMCEGAIDADKDAVFVHNLVHNEKALIFTASRRICGVCS